MATQENDPEYYQAQNSFGAATTVERITREVVGVVIGDKLTSIDEIASLGGMGVMNLSVPSGEAKRMKEDVSLLIIMKPNAPFTEETTDYTEPTLDKPVERLISLDMIIGDIVGAWLYNYSTGEVYNKIG